MPEGQPLESERSRASERAVAAPEQLPRPSPGRSNRGAGRLRSFVLRPRGGGTRRRASDVVRLGLAVLVVAVSVPLIRANASIEIQVDQLLTPLPTGVRWLAGTLWQLGSFGVIVTLALGGLLVPRLVALRQMAIAGLGTLGLCLLLGPDHPAAPGTPAGRRRHPHRTGRDRLPPADLGVGDAGVDAAPRVHLRHPDRPPVTRRNRPPRTRLDAELVAALTALRKRQLEESTIAGTAYGSAAVELDWYRGGEYVITDRVGTPVHPEWYSDEFRRLL